MADIPLFAAELRRLRDQRGLSIRGLAALVHHGKSYVHELETGQKQPTPAVARRLDDALGASGRLIDLLSSVEDDTGSQVEAIELARRIAASDVSNGTLDRLDLAADAMAMSYATTPPVILLPRVQRHLQYVASLFDARKTLHQHRRLLVAGGWLALLRATLHIDLRQSSAAESFLATAAEMAAQAGHREMTAWCLETRAWSILITGDFRRARDLSQHAQAVAPPDGSAFIQATAQEGRAWARIGDRRQTRDTLDRVERLAGSRGIPEHPEHHYQYDPTKARSYAATTLSWVGDPAAETVAREVIAELVAENARPRRIASAQLDLGLALLSATRPDEAAATASIAIRSGRIVPSNWWRVSEVVSGVCRFGIPEARDLRDEYEAYTPAR